MRKIHEYLQHAAECRDMARTASPSHRQQLEQMAETWEQLADAVDTLEDGDDIDYVGASGEIDLDKAGDPTAATPTGANGD